jgi:tetratricopeptide (TPR) repeat protein
MGKTSLAREIAARCLDENSNAPKFDAIVWVSDKDRPGTTTLSIVLDEIARTLDYPGFTQFEHEEKRREVEQLLRRQKVLVVVDNFETITDGVLLNWLLRLPEPSKALITSREYSRAFRNNTFVLDLRGMSEAEAKELINQRLKFLKMDKLVTEDDQLTPLITVTGGNPKALEIALGCLKYERQPLQQVVDDLYAARGSLFDDLFTRCWSLLDEAARRVLLSMPLFVDSASTEALSTTADVQGFAFDRSIERLTDLALLDVQQNDLSKPARYGLHSLVRSFSTAKLNEQPTLEAGTRERWVKWYIELVSKVGYCWDDLSKLKLLDPEQETIYSVAIWSFHNSNYDKAMQLSKNVAYYYKTRGLWDRSLSLTFMYTESAHNLAKTLEEVMALGYCIQMLSLQGNIDEAKKYVPRLNELSNLGELDKSPYFEMKYAMGLYFKACHDLDSAQKVWEEVLRYPKKLPEYSYVLIRKDWVKFFTKKAI